MESTDSTFLSDTTYMKLNYVFQGYIENQFYLLPINDEYDCRFFRNDHQFCGEVDPVSPFSKHRWSLGMYFFLNDL